jgi:hypothetical protein
VRPERLELPTYWFEASRSIHLSYGRTPIQFRPILSPAQVGSLWYNRPGSQFWPVLGAGFKPVERYLVPLVGSTPTGFRHTTTQRINNLRNAKPADLRRVALGVQAHHAQSAGHGSLTGRQHSAQQEDLGTIPNAVEKQWGKC